MIIVKAPAKVNFFLEITGRRPDGYHTLSTLFQTVSLCDELSFQESTELTMTCSMPGLPTDERNLVYRAAASLREALKEKRGARIHLEKIVPTGAGLGGGSSDAAAVLKSLPELWRTSVPDEVLHQIAISLGADVPFFLRGGLCAAEGIGEILKPLKPLPRLWLVLVYPGFGVSTKEAYGRVKLPFNETHSMPSPEALGLPFQVVQKHASPHTLSLQGRGSKGEGRSHLFFNRFEEFVFPLHPELPRLKQELVQNGATAALMSGSGSSVFGIVPAEEVGQELLKLVRRQYSQSWLVHTDTTCIS